MRSAAIAAEELVKVDSVACMAERPIKCDTRQVSRKFRFRQVDVFTDRPLHGNPLAVFLEADGMTDDEMQSVASEMMLSETTFVVQPSAEGAAAGADYRVRIFTPTMELPFAGHPSIGTAWALAEAGRFGSGGQVSEPELKDVPKEFTPAELERWSMVSDTPAGRLRHLGPVVRLSETPPRWARPSVPLGYHEPVWPARAT